MLSDADIITAHAPRYNDMLDETCCTCGNWRLSDEDAYAGPYERIDLEIDRQHAAHVAAMLRDNRTLHTVEDIAALPDGTEIRFHHRDDGYPMGDEIHTVTNGMPAGFDKIGLNYWLTSMYAIVTWHPEHDRQQP